MAIVRVILDAFDAVTQRKRRCALHLCRSARACGPSVQATVIIVGSYGPSLISFRGDLIRLLAERGYQVYAVSPPHDGLKGRLAGLGARFVPLPVDRRGISILGDMLLVWQLRRLIKRLDPVCVIPYTLKPVLYSAMAARLLRRSEVVVPLITGRGRLFISDLPWQARTIRRVVETLYRLSLWRLRRIVFQNYDDEDFFRRRRLIRSSVQSLVVPGSGVNLTRFPLTALPRDVTFIMVSRLLYAKGVSDYVEAARLLRLEHQGVECLLVGPREQGAGSVSLAQLSSWLEKGYVTYLGPVADIRPYLGLASVAVLPSYYPEGVPRSLLEAMSMGRPIVTTDSPGCREAVREGISGFLVPPRDPTALHSAMRRFLDDPYLAKAMGAESRRLAAETFDVNRVNLRLVEFLHLPPAFRI